MSFFSVSSHSKKERQRNLTKTTYPISPLSLPALSGSPLLGAGHLLLPGSLAGLLLGLILELLLRGRQDVVREAAPRSSGALIKAQETRGGEESPAKVCLHEEEHPFA